MADWANINALSLVPGAAPTTNTANAGGDRFAAQFGAKYLVRWNNTGSTVTVTLDDPVSASPANAKAWNPDVDLSLTGSQARGQTIEANRFRDANGWINFAYSATPTGVTAEIHGPL